MVKIQQLLPHIAYYAHNVDPENLGGKGGGLQPPQPSWCLHLHPCANKIDLSTISGTGPNLRFPHTCMAEDRVEFK